MLVGIKQASNRRIAPLSDPIPASPAPSHIARLRPQPLPAINPVPEYRAEGRRRAWYEDMKTALQVPWMGVVTMAFAEYPRFFDTVWTGLKPLCMSEPYIETSRTLRLATETGIAALKPRRLNERLTSIGYAPVELNQIRAMIEVLSHGNFAYLPFVALCRALLEDVPFGDEAENREAPPFSGWHAPDEAVPFVLMEPHHSTRATRALYEDIRETLGLNLINTDYRALGRWSSYLALSWQELKPHIDTAAYEAEVQATHDRLFNAALALPNPRDLTPAMVQQAAEEDASVEEVLAVVRLFAWLLPGLVTNVAYFRAQLLTPEASQAPG